MVVLRLGTYNIRNTTDRYAEREPLLVQTIESMQADLLGLQEVAFGDGGQTANLIAARKEQPFSCWEAPSEEKFTPPWPDFRLDGNVVLTNPAIKIEKHELLSLSNVRVAQRLFVRLPNDKVVLFCNTHLHHTLDNEGVAQRQAQARQFCAWVKEVEDQVSYIVLVGDFNAAPSEPAYEVFESFGYKSAYKSVHGWEPKYTFPSGLQAPTMDTDPAGTFDYIWFKGDGAVAISALVVGDQPLPTDSTIYPSDHLGIVAELDFQ
eukprot:GILK01003504.1.p1 GENE.GILK01003504.1~~GILK01003504.1.p1  ORF type:complete len:263 (+),score=25.95 GILK01003504.1:157-945(+)